jgi:hypothetical protein
MDARAQIAFLWAGLVMVVGLAVGLIVAGWLPPPAPNQSPLGIAHMYVHDHGRIRAGVLILFITTPLVVPFCAVLAMHMKERGRWTPWALTQFGLGCLGLVPTLVAHFCWLTAAYHPERRSPGEIALLHQLGWLNIVGTVGPVLFQMVVVGAFVFRCDGHVFPRWVGYFNFWLAALVLPGLFVYCFSTGAFDYRGICTFWLAAGYVAVWYPTMFVVLRRAILAPNQTLHEATRTPSIQPA